MALHDWPLLWGTLYRVIKITDCDVGHRVNGWSGTLTSPGSALGINPAFTKKSADVQFYYNFLLNITGAHCRITAVHAIFWTKKTLHAYEMLHFTAKMQYFGRVPQKNCSFPITQLKNFSPSKLPWSREAHQELHLCLSIGQHWVSPLAAWS